LEWLLLSGCIFFSKSILPAFGSRFNFQLSLGLFHPTHNAGKSMSRAEARKKNVFEPVRLAFRFSAAGLFEFGSSPPFSEPWRVQEEGEAEEADRLSIAGNAVVCHLQV